MANPMTETDSGKRITSSDSSLSTRMLLGLTGVLCAILVSVGMLLYMFFSAQLEKDARERINMAVLSARQMIDQSVSHTIEG